MLNLEVQVESKMHEIDLASTKCETKDKSKMPTESA